MKKLYLLFFFLPGLFGFVRAQDTPHFNTYWKNALHVESDDGDFKLKFGGRIQYDIMFIKEDDSLHTHFDGKNGAEFRRARLYTSGTLFKFIKYKFQVDFAPAKVVIKDAYLLFTKIPVVGNFQAGNFKQPFGMEMITSSKYITNMERPLVNQFDHDRDLGFMVFNHHFDKRLAWYAGYFVPSNNLGKYVGNKYQLTGRVSGLPLYKTDNGYKVLHIDVAYSYHYNDNKGVHFKVKPEAHLAPGYLDVEIDGVGNSHRGNAGVALVLGPFSWQSEYTFALVHPSAASDLNEEAYHLDAYFATVSWFITGEHKNFNRKKTVFDRVNPKKNLGKGGVGAFELSLRYSAIDFDDRDLQAGAMNDLTAGLNWYMNPAVRVTFNYIYANVVDLGHANIFQMRFQVAF
jgi:phosphate-selective porin OprO/OprP